MATATTTQTTLTGTVVKVNGNGFKLDAHDGWLNISRYAQPDDAPMPTLGERVTATLDKAGFIRKVERVPAPAHPAEPEPTPVQTPHPAAPPDRERLMLRMSALRGACEVFAGSGQSGQVITALAEDLERWALR